MAYQFDTVVVAVAVTKVVVISAVISEIGANDYYRNDDDGRPQQHAEPRNLSQAHDCGLTVDD